MTKRYALPLALVLILIGVLRIASTWRQISITFDESYHFSCGLDYLTMGTLCVGENPFLGPIASAVLPVAAGVRPDPALPERRDERTYRERTEIGSRQLHEILLGSPDPWRVIALMRAGILPFFVLAALTVFFASRHWFGPEAAVWATALFTLIPTVLAHAGLATTDMALTATMPATFFLLMWWTESPTWPRAVLVGIAGGLALFAKFSSIPYLGASILVALLIARPKLSRQLIPGAVAAAAIAVFLLIAGYRFNIARLVASFHELAEHAKVGHGGAYLLGHFGERGWWYYYPVALAVKTPIALLIAFAAGLRRRAGLPLALLLGILLVAMPGKINLGTRHILPVFVAMSMIGGLGLVRLAQRPWLMAASLLVWMAISGARAHPDYLSYFNEFAGDRPDRILLDSDLDWDQDWVLAGRFLRAQGASEVTLDQGRPPADLLERVYGLPHVVENGRGWHIVDATRLRYTTDGRLPAPAKRIGGLFLYRALP